MSAIADINSLTLRVYDLVTEPSVLPMVLEDVVAGLGADALGVAGIDLTATELRDFVGTTLISDLLDRPDARLALEGERPLYPLLPSLYGRHSLSSEDELLEHYRRSSRESLCLRDLRAFFRDSYGIHHRYLSPLQPRDGDYDYLAVHYGDGSAEQRSQSICVGSQLLPHLAKAMSISQPFVALERRYQSVLDVLDRLRLAVIITGTDRRVWLMNEAARRVVERQDALRVDGAGRLTTANAPAQCTLANAYRNLLNASTGDALHQRVCLARGKGDAKGGGARREPYIGDCSLLRSDGFGTGASGLGAMLLLSDPESAGELHLGAFEQLYGLTRSERAVCEFLIRGFSNAQIAEERCVSVDTVSSQVKSLLSKTQCRKRGELIHLAHRADLPVVD